MVTREFPALGFDPAPGDAGAVVAAADRVEGAARTFGEASANVSRLNSSGWTGQAADAFRTQLEDLPRDLDLAARSHRTTARTLSDYGSGLQVRQRRAAELEGRAEELTRLQAAAVGEVNRIAGQTAAAGSAELATLTSRYDAARSRADGLGAELGQVVAEARRLHGEHRSSAASAARSIRNVADAPYREPGWLSRAWDSVKGWIADHADVLASISTVLKGVSAVLGVLSLVPGLQFLAPFALLAAGAALLIDVGIRLGTGHGSWTAIGIDAALTFLPAGRILAGLRGARTATRTGDDLLRAAGDITSRGNPVRGLGSTAVHSRTAGNASARRLFPELAETNPLFRRTPATAHYPGAGTQGYGINCQSCAVAVDRQLAGAPAAAIRRELFKPGNWEQRMLNAVGINRSFQNVGSYDDIARELHAAGDGARGIIHGMRRAPDGSSVAGHVFNVVNRNGRIYYLDGQTGGWAYLENFSGGMTFVRTN